MSRVRFGKKPEFNGIDNSGRIIIGFGGTEETKPKYLLTDLLGKDESKLLRTFATVGEK